MIIDLLEEFKNHCALKFTRFSNQVKRGVRYSSFRVEQYEDVQEHYLNDICAVYLFLKNYTNREGSLDLYNTYMEYVDKIENYDISSAYNEAQEMARISREKSRMKRT
mgnify:FL=1